MWRQATCARAARAIAVAWLVALGTPTALAAQAPSRRAAATNTVTPSARQRALDEWLVTRYRGVQLLPDTERARTVVTDAPLPRVESANDGALVDTLFAVHFGASREMASLHADARVRLTASSGAISMILAEVVARRAFRTPSRPGVDTTAGADSMRSGWAYLALVPRRGEKPSAAVYRGWLLFEQPDSTRGRAPKRRVPTTTR